MSCYLDQLENGTAFIVDVAGTKGELVDCNVSGAKVKILRGDKFEIIWWSSKTLVTPIDKKDLINASEEAKLSPKRGKKEDNKRAVSSSKPSNLVEDSSSSFNNRVSFLREESIMSDENTAVVEVEVVSELKVNRDQMVRIYQLIGYKSADGWNNKQLAERSIPFEDSDLQKMVSDEDKEMLDKILSANEAKLPIVVEGEKKKHVKAPERNNTVTNNTEETEVTTATVEKVEKKEKVQKVSNPPRVTKGSKINGVLSAAIGECVTAQKVAETLGIDDRMNAKIVSAHCKYHIKNGTSVGKCIEEVEGQGWRWKSSDNKDFEDQDTE